MNMKNNAKNLKLSNSESEEENNESEDNNNENEEIINFCEDNNDNENEEIIDYGEDPLIFGSQNTHHTQKPTFTNQDSFSVATKEKILFKNQDLITKIAAKLNNTKSTNSISLELQNHHRSRSTSNFVDIQSKVALSLKAAKAFNNQFSNNKGNKNKSLFGQNSNDISGMGYNPIDKQKVITKIVKERISDKEIANNKDDQHIVKACKKKSTRKFFTDKKIKLVYMFEMNAGHLYY